MVVVVSDVLLNLGTNMGQAVLMCDTVWGGVLTLRPVLGFIRWVHAEGWCQEMGPSDRYVHVRAVSITSSLPQPTLGPPARSTRNLIADYCVRTHTEDICHLWQDGLK